MRKGHEIVVATDVKQQKTSHQLLRRRGQKAMRESPDVGSKESGANRGTTDESESRKARPTT